MKRIVAPSSIPDAAKLVAASNGAAEFLAGGTDVVDRVRQLPPHAFVSPDDLVRIARILPRSISLDGAGDTAWLNIGAGANLVDVAADPTVVANPAWRALVEACDHTATPQIRSSATVGGALRQKVRCMYFRHPERQCLRKGGAACLARDGDHEAHSIFDNASGCIAVHPSTLLCALLALRANVAYTDDAGVLHTDAVDDLVGHVGHVNTHDALDDLAMPSSAVITDVLIPPAGVPQKAAARSGYLRASTRELADWATVEVAARLVFDKGKVFDARIALGAVARTPRRATKAEHVLVGKPLTRELIADAASEAADGATPLHGNAYKVHVVEGAVRALLERFV